MQKSSPFSIQITVYLSLYKKETFTIKKSDRNDFLPNSLFSLLNFEFVLDQKNQLVVCANLSAQL